MAYMLCWSPDSHGMSYSSFNLRLMPSLLFGDHVRSCTIFNPSGTPHLQSEYSIQMPVTPDTGRALWVFNAWIVDHHRGSTNFHVAWVVCCYVVLFSVANKLVNARVCWVTDNQNVVQILQVMTRKPHLQEIALKVFTLEVQSQICLKPELN